MFFGSIMAVEVCRAYLGMREGTKFDDESAVGMQPIKEFLNKIIWDRRENVSLYEVGVFDRFTKEISFIPLSSVRIEGMSMHMDGSEPAEIPLHRIRSVRKEGKIVWERKIKNEMNRECP